MNQSLILNFEFPQKEGSTCLQIQGPAELLEFLQFNNTACHIESQGTYLIFDIIECFREELRRALQKTLEVIVTQ